MNAPLRNPCGHAIRSLSYLAAFADAEARDKRGEKQTRCPACGLWLWPDEVPATRAKPADEVAAPPPRREGATGDGGAEPRDAASPEGNEHA